MLYTLNDMKQFVGNSVHIQRRCHTWNCRALFSFPSLPSVDTPFTTFLMVKGLVLQAIPSYSTRRSLFEHYVKTRVEEERKEKRAAQKAAIEGFKLLLDEASEV